MNRNEVPVAQDLVLVGGGHAHAIVLRMLGMKPLLGVRLTLITEASDTPYSGMLPGHVAGFYSREECHIDLRSLAQFAGAQLYLDRVIGLDLANNRVICEQRPPVGFDWLSIDIGSTPKLPAVLGDRSAIIPAKPVREFLAAWDRLVAQVQQQPDRPVSLGIVGGGAGGVELALTMQHRLHTILQAANVPLENLTVHLFHRNPELMPRHNRWVRQRFHALLTQRQIHLHLNEAVAAVQSAAICCQSGLTIQCDAIFWVTEAAAPAWLGKAGLAVDNAGFVLVEDTLRSCSHPHIFAAGDIATMINHPRPKAGVFAVRQGKPLFQNLQRALNHQPLQPFFPQQQYLSLIGTGDGEAVASRGHCGWQSPLLWHWKDQIDRAFMQRFQQLPQMGSSDDLKIDDPAAKSSAPLQFAAPMYCAGCASKVGSRVLEAAIARIHQDHPIPNRSDILIGLDAPDDAAAIQVPAGMTLVQTIDYFTALVNDPFVFGQISANHALSDLFAMGAQPQSALAIATLPQAAPKPTEETLYQLLSGAMTVLRAAGAVLIGGHTVAGTELAFGLSCNGLADPARLLRKAGMQPGQALILTKAIGTGTLFAAQMRQQTKAAWIDAAIASMLQSNQQAATCFLAQQATACTDITGFGLLGHLLEMVRAAQVAVQLELAAIPLLPGALEMVQLGLVSSLQPQNMQAAQAIANRTEVESHPKFPLLFDPQTSGGLLAAVPMASSDDCLKMLHQFGYSKSAMIGTVLPRSTAQTPITIAP